MKTIKPPHSIVLNHRREKLVFLAGSIEMGKVENWQQRVEEYFSEQDEFTVLNPRRDDWDDSWELY